MVRLPWWYYVASVAVGALVGPRLTHAYGWPWWISSALCAAIVFAAGYLFERYRASEDVY